MSDDFVSKVEEKARSDGWMPLEEWQAAGNTPDNWVSAEVFNVRGDFIGQLKGLKHELRQYQSVINDLKEHNIRLAKKEKDKLLSDLRSVKAQAIKEGDGDKVTSIDNMIDEVKEQQKVKEPEKTQTSNISYTTQEVSAAFESWKKGNSWYGSDQEMTQTMDDISYASFMRKVNSGDVITIDDINKIYKQSEQKVKKMHSDKVVAPKVESGSTKSTTSKTKGIRLADFPEDKDGINYRQIAKRFVDSGAFESYDEYYSQLKEIGAI